MRIALAALFVACTGASSPPPAPVAPAAPAAPQLLGRPIATTPLSDAEQTAYARATESLAASPPNLDGDAAAWKPVLKAWLEQRVAAVRAVEKSVHALPEEQRHGLFAAIVSGVAMDDLAGDLIALPLPPSMQTSPYAKDVEAVYRETLEAYALPLATGAKQRLARCSELARSATAVLRPWADYCAQRVGALAELEARVAARRPAHAKARPTPAAMNDCAGGEKVPWEPDALPPDLNAKPKVVVLYDGDKLQGADRDRLLAAVTKRVRAHARLPLLSKRQLAAGEALVAQRKLTAKGPVCGQPPRLTQVLAQKQRNLIVARVSTECVTIIHDADDNRSHDEELRCGLEVSFHRAGTLDRDGVPARLYAPIDSRDAPASAWIAAARELSTTAPEVAGLLGSLTGGGPTRVSIKNYGDDDPWLRLDDTLYGDVAAKLATCVDAPASFDIKLAISPSGATTDVELAPVTAPPAGSHVADCVRDALKATGFPCTRDGKPASVEVRMCVAPDR